MSHLYGCLARDSYYASCTCERIEMREHTEALNNLSQIQIRLNESEDLRAQLAMALQRISELESQLSSMEKSKNP